MRMDSSETALSNQVHDLSPPLEEFRELARGAAMSYFIDIAMRDQRPPTQRAMDAVKASEAKLMLIVPGYVSSLLQQEAQIRARYTGVPITATQLAGMVDAESRKLQEIELQRVEAAVGIDAARSVAEIAALLARLNIPMPLRPGATQFLQA